MVELNPTHEIRDGVDVVWQIPPNPKKVLFIAHGMGVSPLSYWPPTESVPKCTGTAEHKALVKKALEREYAVIAGDSITNEWDSWPTSKPDVQNNLKLLNEWRKEHDLEDLPVFGLGSSLGGDFLSCLATVFSFKAIVMMISGGRGEAWETAKTMGKDFSPVLWVPMIKDERTTSDATARCEALKAKGIPSAIVGAPPLAVHSHFFADHIDDIDKDQSAKVQAVLVDIGVVGQDNSLKKVLMAHDCEPVLRKAGILPAGNEAQSKRDQDILGKLKSGETGGPSGKKGGDGPPGKKDGGGPPGRKDGDGPPGKKGGDGPPRGPNVKPPPGQGPPRSHPIAEGVSNQLRVAEGRHTTTARHCDAIFDWFDGKGWSSE